MEAELDIDAADVGLDGACAAEAGIVLDEEMLDAREGVGDVDLERECRPLEDWDPFSYCDCCASKACDIRCKFQ